MTKSNSNPRSRALALPEEESVEFVIVAAIVVAAAIVYATQQFKPSIDKIGDSAEEFADTARRIADEMGKIRLELSRIADALERIATALEQLPRNIQIGQVQILQQQSLGRALYNQAIVAQYLGAAGTYASDLDPGSPKPDKMRLLSLAREYVDPMLAECYEAIHLASLSGTNSLGVAIYGLPTFCTWVATVRMLLAAETIAGKGIVKPPTRIQQLYPSDHSGFTLIKTAITNCLARGREEMIEVIGRILTEFSPDNNPNPHPPDNGESPIPFEKRILSSRLRLGTVYQDTRHTKSGDVYNNFVATNLPYSPLYPAETAGTGNGHYVVVRNSERSSTEPPYLLKTLFFNAADGSWQWFSIDEVLLIHPSSNDSPYWTRAKALFSNNMERLVLQESFLDLLSAPSARESGFRQEPTGTIALLQERLGGLALRVT